MRGETDDGCGIFPAGAELHVPEATIKKLELSFVTRVPVRTPRPVQQATEEHDLSFWPATVSALILVFASVGVLVAAARVAPDQFDAILVFTIALVIVLLAFVARARGLIGATHMVELFRLSRGRR